MWWPEDAEDKKVMGPMSHVAHEQDGVAVRRPYFITELLPHQIFPVFALPNVSPQSYGFPVNKGLLMTPAVGSHALIGVSEPPRDNLIRASHLVRVVEERRPVSDRFGSVPPTVKLFRVTASYEQFWRLCSSDNSKRWYLGS